MNLNRIIIARFIFIQVIYYSLIGITYGFNPKALKEKPNIVWIIVEDLSPDLGCYGNEAVLTPTIDSLANQGTRFTNVFATGVACAPSRTALVTGFYQNYMGAHHMRYPEELKPDLPDSILPVQIHMKSLGYQTANITSYPGNGKTDWLFKYETDTYGVKRWEDIEPEQPFFARINLRLTHRPFEKDNGNPVNPDEIDLPPYYPDHNVSREDFAEYYESVQLMDGQVSKILDDLKKLDLDENTIIFLFSDHGRPLTRAKNYLYDSGIQVPLLISTLDDQLRERLNLSGVNKSLYSLIDVTASTLELAGGSTYTQGMSILKNPKGRQFVWASADRMGEIFFKSRMIRTKDFKYIRNYNHDFSINSASTAYRKAMHPIYHLLEILNEKDMLNTDQKKLVDPMEAEELYVVSRDPFELHNLVDDEQYLNVLQKLRAQLDSFSHHINDRGLEKDSREIEMAFENYGKISFKKNKSRILKLRARVLNQVEK